MVAQLLVHSLFVVFLAQADPPLDEIVRTIGLDFGSSKKICSTLCKPFGPQR